VSDTRLTPTSYVVLGLIDQLGEATSYEMKGLVAIGVGNFWSLPHTQLYTEPARLAEAGYLIERRERSGRRRKLYSLTKRGRDALDEWRVQPAAETYEIRDAGLLKLYFGADVATVAAAQLAAHRKSLAAFEELHEAAVAAEVPRGALLALEAGIGHEREYIRFWEALA
jgi:PadR family transcriptional regulator, regulatory protein AphA